MILFVMGSFERWSDFAKKMMLTLGQWSLTAYVIHIPFCYGRIARPMIQQLDVEVALVLCGFLIYFTYLSVIAIDRITRSWQD